MKKLLTKVSFFEFGEQGKTLQEIADEFDISLEELNEWIKKNPTIVRSSGWIEKTK